MSAVNEVERRITRDLRAAGVREGGVLLVHSSLSSMGSVPGGPETVILGLLRALGSEGTLLMPALSYERVHAGQTTFDVLHTPSNVGAIPEYFRTRPGTMRSVHPTHSVSGVGPQAEALLSQHYLDRTPVGEHSPFRGLRDLCGQVLFLGCGLRPNTSMHGVEEVAEAPYLFGPEITYRIIAADRTETLARHRRHGFGEWRQRYDRIAPLLREGGEIVSGHVLKATTYVLEAQPMWARALVAFRTDPCFFVERAASAMRADPAK